MTASRLLSINKNANNLEETVVEGLNTIHLGRGYFEFVPQSGFEYHLEGNLSGAS